MKYEVTRSEAMTMVIGLVSEGKAIPDGKKAATLDALKRIAGSLAKSSSKKKAGGKTEAQLKEDEKIRDRIMSVLDETGRRAGEIGALVGISQSKATAMLKVLIEAGKATRTVEKGVARYKAAAPVVEVELSELPDLLEGDDYYEADETNDAEIE